MDPVRADPLTDGPLYSHVHGPIAGYVVHPLLRNTRPPSLDQFTLSALVLGLCGAVAILLASPHSTDWLVPAWLLFAATIAGRCRRLLAPGDAANGLLDLLVGSAFWLALSLRAAPLATLGSTLALLAIGSAVGHGVLYTQVRARFARLTGEPEGEDAARGLSAALGPVLAASQRRFAAALLGPELRDDLPSPSQARALLAGAMKMATLLGPDTHLALAYAAAALSALDVGWSYWIATLAVLVGLNLWALMVVLAWRRAEALVRRVGA